MIHQGGGSGVVYSDATGPSLPSLPEPPSPGGPWHAPELWELPEQSPLCIFGLSQPSHLGGSRSCDANQPDPQTKSYATPPPVVTQPGGECKSYFIKIFIGDKRA